MTQDDKPKMEEQAISKAAEMQLISTLEAAEDINVNVRTDLLKIVQGQVDAVAIAGEGLVLQKDIRVQELEMHIDSVSVNPLSAIFGKIELNHPTDATARIVLTEQDINRAIASDYIRSKMQNFELNVDGQPVILELQQVKLVLPGDGKIKFIGNVLLHKSLDTQQLHFTAIIRPRTNQQPIILESFHCGEGEGISLDIIAVLMPKLKELANLPYIELEEMAFRIVNLDVQQNRLILETEAHVKQIPAT